MLTLVLFQPLVFGTGDGVPKLSTGGVASRLMVTDALVVPPADVTEQLNVTPAVSVVTLPVSQPAVPRMLPGTSLMAQATCTSLVYQPLLPGVPLICGVIPGAVRSMLTGGVVKVALLPAASLTTTCVSSALPLPVMSTGLGELVEATPEVASLALNEKATSPVFQPEAFGAGEPAAKLSTGGVASRFTV